MDNDEEFVAPPAAADDVADLAAPLPACGSGDDPLRQPRGMKASNEALRKKRQSHHNTVDFAGNIFGDDFKMTKLDIHWEVEETIVIRF